MVGDFNTLRSKNERLSSAPAGEAEGSFLLMWKTKGKKLTCSEAIKNAVLAQYRVAVCAD